MSERLKIPETIILTFENIFSITDTFDTAPGLDFMKALNSHRVDIYTSKQSLRLRK